MVGVFIHMDERTSDIGTIFDRLFLLGVGAFSLTKEKMQETVDELVERGRMSREEGRDLVSEIGERGEQERAQFMDYVRDTVRKTLERANVASKADIERLETEIAVLRAEVLSRPGGAGPGGSSAVVSDVVIDDLSEGNL